MDNARTIVESSLLACSNSSNVNLSSLSLSSCSNISLTRFSSISTPFSMGQFPLEYQIQNYDKLVVGKKKFD